MKKLIYLFFLALIVACGSTIKQKADSKNITLEDINQHNLKVYIHDTGFAKILKVREKALATGYLKDHQTYVKAFLICDGDSVESVVRLKGDHVDHLKGNRWSLRVKTKKGKVLGESKFSLQGAHTRSYINEWIFHEMLREEGLIGLQYEFLDVNMNDIDSLSGVYAFESHFKSEILSNQGKKVGPIIRYNEDLYWNFNQKRDKSLDFDSVVRARTFVELLNKKGYKKEDGAAALALLNKFTEGKVAVEQTFDLEKWAKFLVINGLFAEKHGLRWHNLRFYFNDETRLLEPIGFDCGSWQSKYGAWYMNSKSMETFYRPFYSSEKFKELLLVHSKRMANKQYLDGFFTPRKTEMDGIISRLREERKYNPNIKGFYKQADSISVDIGL